MLGRAVATRQLTNSWKLLGSGREALPAVFFPNLKRVYSSSPPPPASNTGYTSSETFSSEQKNKEEQNNNKKKWLGSGLFSVKNKLNVILSPIIRDDWLRQSVVQMTSYGVYGIIGITALSTCGVDTTPLLTGLGLGGVATGFIVKDTVQSAVAALSLQLRCPFAKGDLISLPKEGIKGRVISMDTRYVYLEDDGVNDPAGKAPIKGKAVKYNTLVVPASLVGSSYIVVMNKRPMDIHDNKD